MKAISGIYKAPAQHWVGDGFPVRSLFSYNRQGAQVSPFLLADLAGPYVFEPNPPGRGPRGVGTHPHRGFETVTIVYEGEVAHKDSTGQGGVIGPGDVQWMTAGAGILHQEFHSPGFSLTGGNFEMVQLWVNLPAADKMAAPGYQAISADAIPIVHFDKDAGFARVIAGSYAGTQGPAHTFSPMSVWDVRLNAGGEVVLPIPEGWNGMVILLTGEVQVNGEATLGNAQMTLLNRSGEDVHIRAERPSKLLLLAGAPIDEPIVGYGPFVMNTDQQINDAINDFNSGRFGRVAD
ncbi:MAG: pirin family protein [Cellvibrionaceae bacterium]|nr:pirin family protein [Cellvibrionaceae bacterium]